MEISATDDLNKGAEVVMDEEKQPVVTWDAETEKKLRWKCDRHVLPCITLLFFLSFLDRTNIGISGFLSMAAHEREAEDRWTNDLQGMRKSRA